MPTCPWCDENLDEIIKVSVCKGTVYDHIIFESNSHKEFASYREDLDESTLTFQFYRCPNCGHESEDLDDFTSKKGE